MQMNDLTPLCPSLIGLKEMLSTCEVYVKDYIILFNEKKGKVMYLIKIISTVII